MPVPGWAVDRHPVILQALASGVDVVHCVGEMAEVAPAGVGLGVPVEGELDLCRLVTGRGEEDERVTALRVFVALELHEAERIAIEAQRSVEVGHPDHGVQVLHGASFRTSRTGPAAG